MAKPPPPIPSPLHPDGSFPSTRGSEPWVHNSSHPKRTKQQVIPDDTHASAGFLPGSLKEASPAASTEAIIAASAPSSSALPGGARVSVAQEWRDRLHPRFYSSTGVSVPYRLWTISTGKFCRGQCAKRCDPCREGIASDLSKFGTGVSAYFKLIKTVGFAALLFTILLLPVFALTWNANGAGVVVAEGLIGAQPLNALDGPITLRGSLASFTLGALARERIDKCGLWGFGPNDGIRLPAGIFMSGEDVAWTIAVFDLIVSLALFGFAYSLMEAVGVEEADEHRMTITVAEFAVEIPSIPKETTADALAEYLAQYARARPRKVTLAYDMGHLEALAQKRRILLAELEVVSMKLGTLLGSHGIVPKRIASALQHGGHEDEEEEVAKEREEEEERKKKAVEDSALSKVEGAIGSVFWRDEETIRSQKDLERHKRIKENTRRSSISSHSSHEARISKEERVRFKKRLSTSLREDEEMGVKGRRSRRKKRGSESKKTSSSSPRRHHFSGTKSRSRSRSRSRSKSPVTTARQSQGSGGDDDGEEEEEDVEEGAGVGGMYMAPQFTVTPKATPLPPKPPPADMMRALSSPIVADPEVETIGDIIRTLPKETQGEGKELSKKRIDLLDKAAELRAAAYAHGEYHGAVRAYITFERREHAIRVKKALGGNIAWWVWRSLTTPKDELFLQQYLLAARAPPLPSAVLWHNLALQPSVVFGRRLLSFCITLLLLFISIAAVVGVASTNTTGTGEPLVKLGPARAGEKCPGNVESRGAGAGSSTEITSGVTFLQPFVITIINVVMDVALRRMAEFEGHPSTTDRDASVFVGLSSRRVVNTAVLPILLNIPVATITSLGLAWLWSSRTGYGDLTAAWYGDVGVSLVLTMVFNIFTPLAAPSIQIIRNYLYRWWLLSGNAGPVAQRTLNEAYVGPPFRQPDRVADVLSTLCITIVLSPALPALVPILGIALTFLFWMDLTRFISFTRTPPWTDARTIRRLSKILPIAITARVAFGLWAITARVIATPHVADPVRTAISIAGPSARQDSGLVNLLSRVLQAHAIPHTIVLLAALLFGVILLLWAVVRFFAEHLCPQQITLDERDLHRSKERYHVPQTVAADARTRSRRDIFADMPLSDLLSNSHALSDLPAYDPLVHPRYQDALAMVVAEDVPMHDQLSTTS